MYVRIKTLASRVMALNSIPLQGERIVLKRTRMANQTKVNQKRHKESNPVSPAPLIVNILPSDYPVFVVVHLTVNHLSDIFSF